MVEDIIKQIINISNSNIDNNDKHQNLEILWTKLWKNMDDTNKDEIYNLYLCCENESFIVNQEPISKMTDVSSIISDYKENGYFKQEDVLSLLNWDIANVRNNLGTLGIEVKTNSLNGFCELSQALTIMPFENLGLKVTKNKAQDAFNYDQNHAFGTVTFPILENNEVKEKTYLIDATYRQFFSTVRCNEGMYYTNGINGLPSKPDIGYFMKDIAFATSLMKNGYFELTDTNAKKYGEPFSKEEINYKDNIINTNTDYSVKDVEGLNIDFPHNMHI